MILKITTGRGMKENLQPTVDVVEDFAMDVRQREFSMHPRQISISLTTRLPGNASIEKWGALSGSR